MSGVILRLPTYAVMAWSGKNLNLFLIMGWRLDFPGDSRSCLHPEVLGSYRTLHVWIPMYIDVYEPSLILRNNV